MDSVATKAALPLRILFVLLTISLVLAAVATVIGAVATVPGVGSKWNSEIEGTKEISSLLSPEQIQTLQEQIPFPMTVESFNVTVPATVRLFPQIAGFASVVVLGGLTVFVLYLARRYVSGLLRGGPEAFWNIRLVRQAGWTVLAIGVLDWTFQILNSVALATAMTGVPSSVHLTFWKFFIAVVVLAFSVILQRGLALQREVEGLV